MSSDTSEGSAHFKLLLPYIQSCMRIRAEHGLTYRLPFLRFVLFILSPGTFQLTTSVYSRLRWQCADRNRRRGHW